MDDGHVLDTLKSWAGDALRETRETSELHSQTKLLQHCRFLTNTIIPDWKNILRNHWLEMISYESKTIRVTPNHCPMARLCRFMLTDLCSG